jgi:DNA-binding response OmpR family regulator
MNDPQDGNTTHAVRFGEYLLDFRRMELCRAGQTIELTLREFKVLRFLVLRPKVVVSRQKLIGSAWPKRARSSYRTVDNCIAKLRQKIESNPECPVFIRTIHGVGYKFVPPEDTAEISESRSPKQSEESWEA